jgi:hypothetical protein
MMNMLKRIGGTLILAAAFAAASPAHAQNDSIGAPALKGFSLPGTVTTPPPQQREERPAETAPSQSLPRDTQAPATQRDQPRMTPARPPSTVNTPRTTEPGSAPAPAPAEQPRNQPPAPVAAEPQPLPEGPLFGTIDDLPIASAPAPVDTAVPLEEESWSTLWVLLALVLAGAAALYVYLRLGRREAPAAGAPAATAVAPPRPPRPAPAPPKPTPEGPRPWIELEFAPERAVTTGNDASVHYQLMVRNVGEEVARNVRIEVKMFNVGVDQDREISAFFSRPVAKRPGAPFLHIPPKGQTSFQSAVSMPKSSWRAVVVQGRSLFIPMVAFNIVYEWGDGHQGQTGMSYVVGTQPKAPSEKMGAIRLDLGPRIWRSLGQRPNKIAKMV